MQNDTILTAIYNIYLECNLHVLPIDCFMILQHYGFKSFSYSQLKHENPELHYLCSSYSSDAFMHRSKRIVAYNDLVNPGRLRFSLMHELGHLFLKTDDEDDADEFASHILAPRVLIHRYRLQTADQIHDKFGLSYAASNRALSSYKEWCWNIRHSASRKPSDPELQLEQIFFPKKEIPVTITSSIEDENDIVYDEPGDRYLYIWRALRAGLPVPKEYKKDLQRYRKMGFKLI